MQVLYLYTKNYDKKLEDSYHKKPNYSSQQCINYFYLNEFYKKNKLKFDKQKENFNNLIKLSKDYIERFKNEQKRIKKSCPSELLVRSNNNNENAKLILMNELVNAEYIEEFDNEYCKKNGKWFFLKLNNKESSLIKRRLKNINKN